MKHENRKCSTNISNVLMFHKDMDYVSHAFTNFSSNEFDSISNRKSMFIEKGNILLYRLVKTGSFSACWICRNVQESNFEVRFNYAKVSSVVDRSAFDSHSDGFCFSNLWRTIVWWRFHQLLMESCQMDDLSILTQNILFSSKISSKRNFRQVAVTQVLYTIEQYLQSNEMKRKTKRTMSVYKSERMRFPSR